MVKKLVSGLILVHWAQISAPPPQKKIFFSWIFIPLGVRYYCKLSLYAISRKTNEAKLEKMAKNLAAFEQWMTSK